MPAIPVRLTRSGRLAALLAAWMAITVCVVPVHAANELHDAAVTPRNGTTVTAFEFSVRYASSQPPRAATAVRADLIRTGDGASVTVPLARIAGDDRNGTWSGTRTLAAGTWQVSFHAISEQGANPDLSAGTITVDAPTQPPSLTPSPAPSATVRPTPSPLPSSSRTPTPTPTPGVTDDPTPATPASTPREPIPIPSRHANTAPPARAPSTSGASVPASPVPAEGASRSNASPGSSDSQPPRGSFDATESPPATPVASAAEVDPTAAGSSMPWILVGGGMATAGAAILGVQLIGLQRRRRR